MDRHPHSGLVQVHPESPSHSRPRLRLSGCRRRFLKLGVITGAILGVCGATSGWGGAAASVIWPIPVLDEALAARFKIFDAIRRQSGVSALVDVLSAGKIDDVQIMFKWIEEEAVVSAYPLLVAALTDSRLEIRTHAAGRLTRVPMRRLKQQLAKIRLAASSEQDSLTCEMLQQLANDVEAA